MKTKLHIVLLLPLLLTTWATVHAQSDESNRLFADGVELYNVGKYREATSVFEKVDSIDKADSTMIEERKGYGKMWAAYCCFLAGDTLTAHCLIPYRYSLQPVDRRLTVVSDSLSFAATQAWNDGDLDEDLRLILECAEKEKETLGKNSCFRANSLQIAASVYEAKGDFLKAVELSEEANDIYRTNNDWTNIISGGPTLLQSYAATEQFEKANNLFEEIIAYSAKMDTICNETNADLNFYMLYMSSYMGSWIDAATFTYPTVRMLYNLKLTETDAYYNALQLSTVATYMCDYNNDARIFADSLIAKEAMLGLDTLNLYSTIARMQEVRSKMSGSAALNRAKELLHRIKAEVGEDDAFYVEGLLLLYDYSLENSYSKDFQTILKRLEKMIGEGINSDMLAVKIKQRLGFWYNAQGNIDKAVQLYTENTELLRPSAERNLAALTAMANNVLGLAQTVVHKSKEHEVLEQLNMVKDIYERNGLVYENLYYRILTQMTTTYGDLGNYEMRYRLAKQIVDAYGIYHRDDFVRNLAQTSLEFDNMKFGNNEAVKEVRLDNRGKKWSIDEMGDMWTILMNACLTKDKSLFYAAVDTFETLFPNEYKAMAPKLILQYRIIINCLMLKISDSEKEYLTCLNELKKIRKSILKHFNTSSVYYRYYLESLLGCYYALDKYEELIPLVKEYNSLLTEDIRLNFQNMTYEERTAFWNDNSRWFLNDIPLLIKNTHKKEFMSDAYNSQLLSKGLLLNTELEMRNILAESNDTLSLRLFDDKEQATSTFRQLVESEYAESVIIDSLRNEIQAIERQLMSQNKKYGDVTRFLNTTWEDVKGKLNNNEVAMEFVQVSDGDDSCFGVLMTYSWSEQPNWIELCKVNEITDVSTVDYYTTEKLTRLLWRKIENQIKYFKPQTIYFSATGLLHNIALEYLPLEGGATIGEKYKMIRLSSTKEILNKDTASKEYHHAVLFGDLDYWGDECETAPQVDDNRMLAEENSSRKRGVAGCDGTIGPVENLEYTKEEIDGISQVLSEKGIEVKTCTGIDGDEQAIKQLSGNSPDIIHIATHGLYKHEQQEDNWGTLGAFGIDVKRNATMQEDLQLLCSGLAMANANRALAGEIIRPGEEDGLLTASEISRLDMRGTDLAVLSACETALGAISSEGVFGLQRGFKKTGVKSLMMSLWKVDDEATQILMTQFYKNLISGTSKQKSLSEAQAYLRRYKNGKYDSPEFWAAFILLDALD